MRIKKQLVTLKDFYNDLHYLAKKHEEGKEKIETIKQEYKNLRIQENNELINISKQIFKKFLPIDNIIWDSNKISFYNNNSLFLHITFTTSSNSPQKDKYNDIEIFPVINSQKPYKGGFQVLSKLFQIIKYVELNKSKLLNKYNTKSNKFLNKKLKRIPKDNLVYSTLKELNDNIIPFSINRYIGLCITQNKEAKFTSGIRNPGVSFNYGGNDRYILKIQRIFLKETFKDITTPVTLYLEDDEKNIFSISNFIIEKDFNILRAYAFDYKNFE
jgi:hypothetical protein